MTYAAAGQAWTATLDGRTGFNRGYENVAFAMPTGQNGAQADTFFWADGDQPPTYVLESIYSYKIRSDGTTHLWFVFRNFDPGTGNPGAGTNPLDLRLPYAVATGATGDLWGAGTYIRNGNLPENLAFVSLAGYTANFWYQEAVGAGMSAVALSPGEVEFVRGRDQDNDLREIRGQFIYRTF